MKLSTHVQWHKKTFVNRLTARDFVVDVWEGSYRYLSVSVERAPHNPRGRWTARIYLHHEDTWSPRGIARRVYPARSNSRVLTFETHEPCVAEIEREVLRLATAYRLGWRPRGWG